MSPTRLAAAILFVLAALCAFGVIGLSPLGFALLGVAAYLLP